MLNNIKNNSQTIKEIEPMQNNINEFEKQIKDINNKYELIIKEQKIWP